MNPTGFKWGQTASTVTVTFPVPPGVSKTQVDVSITSSTLVAGIKTQPPVLSVRMTPSAGLFVMACISRTRRERSLIM